MSDPVSKSDTINFTVTVHRSHPEKSEREILEGSLNRNIHKLLADLDIPAGFTLSLKYSATKDQKGPAVDISVNGKKCRIPYNVRNGSDQVREKPSFTIMDIVHRNRALLINLPVTRTIVNTNLSMTDNSLKHLKLSEQNRLLNMLVQRGFSIRRLVDFTPDADITAGWTYMQYYDAVLRAVDTTTIRVVHNPAYNELNDSSSFGKVDEMFSLMQEGLFYELGIAFPQVRREIDKNLEDDEFYFQINDVSYPVIKGLKPEKILVSDTTKRLLELNIEGSPAINPANGQECSVAGEVHAVACKIAGLTTWNPMGYLILHLSRQLRRNAGSFLTRDMVEHYIKTLKSAFPILVDSLIQRYDPVILTWILRELLDEEISIRDLRSIVDNLLMINGTIRIDSSKFIVLYPEGTNLVLSGQVQLSDLGFADYAGYIRTKALKRFISHKYSRGGNTLVVYLLDPGIENRLNELKHRQLPEKERIAILEAVYAEVSDVSDTARIPVILTTYEIRRQFRKLIEVEFPSIAVLSFQELSPDMNIQPIARISTKQ